MVSVCYAVDHPAAFRLMFRPEKGSPFGGEPWTTPVFSVLLQVVRAYREQAGRPQKETERVAFSAWGLVHGLAALLVDGPLAPAGYRSRAGAGAGHHRHSLFRGCC